MYNIEYIDIKKRISTYILFPHRILVYKYFAYLL